VKSNLDQSIAFVLPELAIGGVEINTLHLANFLASQARKIHILWERGHPSGLLSQFDKNIQCYKIQNTKMRFLFLEYRKFFLKESTDVIITSSFAVLIHLILAKILTNNSVKIIFKIETNLHEALKDLPTKLDYWLFKALSKYCFSRCKLILCSSQIVAAELSNQLPMKLSKKIFHLYNPIIGLDDLIKYEDVSHNFFTNRSEGQINLISVGRLVSAKGFIELIDIFADLKNRSSVNSFKLLIIGEGDLLPALQKKIVERNLSDHVDIIKFQQDFIKYIQHSDIFICNSLYEGLNNNIVHALAQGIPIISTDCDFGPREILLNGELGCLVGVGNKKEMIEAILSIAKESNFNTSLLKQRAEDFSIVKISNAFCKLLSNSAS
jgi:glycosyltransferase involved in cell wall biosynthesis